MCSVDLPMGGLIYNIPCTEGQWRVVERVRVPGQLGVNCGSGVFKHSCVRRPHAGSKPIAEVGTSGAESITECYPLIVSYIQGVKEVSG